MTTVPAFAKRHTKSIGILRSDGGILRPPATQHHSRGADAGIDVIYKVGIILKRPPSGRWMCPSEEYDAETELIRLFDQQVVLQRRLSTTSCCFRASPACAPNAINSTGEVTIGDSHRLAAALSAFSTICPPVRYILRICAHSFALMPNRKGRAERRWLYLLATLS